MRPLTLLAILSLLAPGAPASATGADRPMDVLGLRCEYATDPLGVDTATPRLSWRLETTRRGARQSAYEIQAASDPARLHGKPDLWSTGKTKGAETHLLEYRGAPLRSTQRVYWRVRVWDDLDRPTAWSNVAEFTTGVLRTEDWLAKWIVAPWVSESLLLRAEFDAKPAVRRATVHCCGLGHHELRLNGEKVGDHLLAPGWSKYNRTVLYETHDVTGQVREGRNAIGLVLGDGMYNAERRNRYSKFQGTFGPQRALVQLELEYEDGSRQRVISDPGWRVDRGPISFNDVYGGEDFDARLDPVGWDTAGFNDSGWTAAVELVRPTGELRGLTCSAPPIRAIETFRALETPRGPAGEPPVFDFGQNASFMPRVTVRGPAGSAIRLTHAEVLDKAGRIDRGTCGGNRGPAYWQYTKKTSSDETWFPRFFYAGCRYLQADPIPAPGSGELPEVVRLDGVVVHTSADPAGSFATSSDLLNRIRTLVRWAQRSNLVSVLTDCPHREKLGWLEQYHLNGPGVRYEFDAHLLFRKGMRDMADSQLPSGLVPNIAPEYVEFDGAFRAATEWGAAVVLVPWQHYQATGDTGFFVDHYPTMECYMEYLASKADHGIVDEGLGDWYDLGPAERPGFAQLTPPKVTASAFYFLCAQKMARIASTLGRKQDEDRYQALAEELRRAWRREFRNPDGTYATGSQCAHAIALAMRLAEPRDRAVALAALVGDIQERGVSTTAGDVGFRYVLRALAEEGRSDLVYAMIHQSDRPGYGYQLAHGATSLTEAWDANHQSSHNHFMLGQITEWFYKDLVGIASDPAAPGYRRIAIRPTPVGDLEWAEATHQSVRGPVRVRWDRSDGPLLVEVSIPPNTSGTVSLPAADGASITESGVAADQAVGVRPIGRMDGRAVFEIESGAYRFLVR